MQKQRKVPPGKSKPAQQPGNKAQVSQIRQNAEKQLAELKKQIQLIQEQSMKAMQESINSVFKTHTAQNLRDLAAQDKDTMKQMAELEKQIQQAGIDNTGFTNYTANPETTAGQQELLREQAMESAEKSVAQAMQSALNSVQEAERSISTLGKYDPPGS